MSESARVIVRVSIYMALLFTVITCPYLSIRVVALLTAMFMFSIDVARMFEPSKKNRRPGDWWNYS